MVRLGETLHKAVVRESQEETGLQVLPVELIEVLERIFHDEDGRVQYHYVLADYLCTVVDGELSAGSDAQEAVWVDGRDLNDFDLAPITLRVVLRALDHSARRH